MFTGLIHEIAPVLAFDGKVLRLKSHYRPKIGDSIAINGVCLSVTKLHNNGFEVELGDETKKVVAVENFKDRVHMEPALRLGDRVEGHFIQGHIDCVGIIKKVISNPSSKDFFIQLPQKYIKFVIPKGSIAIDGVSLTINEVFSDQFRVTVVPITLKKTLFNFYTIGRRVNIETDMFARYLYHLFKPEKKLTWEEVERIQGGF